jgi:hypothetical protein
VSLDVVQKRVEITVLNFCSGSGGESGAHQHDAYNFAANVSVTNLTKTSIIVCNTIMIMKNTRDHKLIIWEN